MIQPKRIELPTIFGMKTVNTYLFMDPEPVLIDCGEKTDQSWEALENGLKEQGLKIKDISKIYITHAHIDHMGMAGRIVENSDAEVWVSDFVYEWAVDLDQAQAKRRTAIRGTFEQNIDFNKAPFDKNMLSLFSRFRDFWDPIPKESVHKFDLDGSISLGGQDWKVMHAPGHCSNQTCFYQEETKELLSADMLLNITPSPVIEASLEPPHERVKSLAIMLKTMAQFAQLEVSKVYPGHYEVFDNHQAIIEHQIARIHSRKEQCYQLIETGLHSFFELLAQLYKGRISFPAIPMLIGYLDLLEEEDRIVIQEKEGLLFYYLKK